MNYFLNKCSLFLAILFFTGILGCKENEVSKESVSLNKAQLIEVNKILLKKDMQRIRVYIESNNLDMTETKTGLWYAISEIGEGETCAAGQRVRLKYSIHLLDGTPCYNSNEDGFKVFEIGRGSVESGLEEGILLLKQGGKAKFIMPPFLAYGLPGDGERIPARSTIIYDLEIIAVE